MVGYPRVTGCSSLREGSKGVRVCVWVCVCVFVCVSFFVSKTPPKRLGRFSSNLVGRCPWVGPCVSQTFEPKVKGQRSEVKLSENRFLAITP